MKKRLPRLLAIAAVIFFCLPAAIRAEVVTLVNGDRLSGQIISENSREITLKHKVLGVLKIPRTQLMSEENKPDKTEELAAESPEAEVQNEKTSGSETAGEEMPPATVPMITKSASTKTVAKKAAATKNKMTPKLLGLFNSSLVGGWKRHFAFGFGGESGDDVSSEWNTAFEGAYKDKSDRISLAASYFYETEDHKKDTSKGRFNIIRDWLLPDSPWFYYGYFLYEHDYFKSWKNRYSVSGGTGYDFISQKDMELSGRIGLGMSRSFGSENRFETEGQIGMEWSWYPGGNKKHQVSFSFIGYPILNDLGEYRTWCQGKWKIDLGLFKGLSFETGFEHDYESQSELSVDDEAYYDLIYFGRLGIDF